jgi:peptidoglycan/LPS O-acetylase OafA/YrhL
MGTQDGEQVAPSKDIWPILAGMRFFFATWVLFDHTYNFGPKDRAMPIFSLSGLMPVLCFLAISGFSIRHSITTKPKGYFERRFWRVVPTNVACTTLALISFLAMGGVLTRGQEVYSMPSALTWLVYFVPAQAIFPVFINALFPTWSLSIEIVYYALAPYFLRADARWMTVLIFPSATLFVVWTFLPAGWAWPYIAQSSRGVGLLAFAWAWLAGWIAYGNRRSTYLCLLFMVIGFTCVAAQPQPLGFALLTRTAWIATFAIWALTMCVVFMSPALNLSTLARRTLDWLGDISFPLYLVHYPLLFLLTSTIWKRHPEWNYGFAQVAAALIAAIVLHYCIDKPLRSLRFARQWRSDSARLPARDSVT